MAIKVRRADEHGRTSLEWLESRHGFSFGGYRNANNIRFGKLIVFNDDVVKPGKGFGSHSHENAEIFSFVLEGALEHRDSGGNHGILEEYGIQRISAGSGITHSEFNSSKEKEVHFLQIWLEPITLDAKPSYEHRSYSDLREKKGIFLLVSGKKGNGAVHLDQDAEFYVAHLDKDEAEINIGPGRGLYVYLLDGGLNIENTSVQRGDSVEITGQSNVKIKSPQKSRFVMLDVPL